MSHITKIRTQMVEKEYLLKAIQDLGYTYEEDKASIQGVYNQKAAVDIKIPLRLSADIGFKKIDDHYEIIADWYFVNSVDRNKFVPQLLQRYAYHATKAKLEEQGFTLVSEEVENKGKQKGQIRLVLRRMA